MSVSDLFVTCAGCGKRYRGSPSSKKYKCNACENLFTFPEQPCKPDPGKVLCSHCWMQVDLSETLTSCPGCGQKISPAHGGRAGPPSALAPASNPGMAVDHTPVIADLARERDELRESKKKQEKIIAELMAQLALAKASQASAPPSEGATDEQPRWELQLEIGELQSKVGALEEQLAAVTADRDAAAAARDEAAVACRALAQRMAGMEAQASDELRAGGSDPADVQARQELEGRLAQLQEHVTALYAERDEALLQAQRAQNELDQFREAAVQTLEPLGAEYNQAMQEILAEAEALLEASRAQEEAARQRMELGGQLKEHLSSVRQQMLDRLGAVLGTQPADASAESSGTPEAGAAPAQSSPDGTEAA